MDGRYILIELPPGFNATNRRAAYDATQKNIGIHTSPYPNRNTHGRPSLNGSDFIMEGIFTDDEIDLDSLAEMIAEEVGLPLPPIITTMKVTIFEGDDWAERNQATRQYLIDNNDDWGEEG